MAEWSKAADCKSVEFLIVGSNPTLPIKPLFFYLNINNQINCYQTTMFNSIKTDLKRRNLYKKYEKKRLLYQALIHDANINPALKLSLIQALNKLPRNSSKVRLKNRCVLTGRSHSVYKFCRLSRIKFRELANKGHIVGCVKASW